MKKFFTWNWNNKKNDYTSLFKIVEIINNDDSYYLRVQVTNRNQTFYTSPKDILQNTNLVSKFSSKCIITITYLAYLEINSPKYSIIAKKFLNDKTIFFIKEKFKKTIITKTAHEIINNRNIISTMKPEDAQTIGFVFASENIYKEPQEKIIALKESNA